MERKGPPLYASAGTSADLSQSLEEDSLVDGPLISADALHSAIRREFQPLPTPGHASLLSVLHVIFVVLSMCLGVLCVLKVGQEDVCKSVLGNVDGESVILFGKVCLWVLVLLFTGCMQHHHGQTRMRGYLRFYRQMQGLKHLPLRVHSTGNVLMLVVLASQLSTTIENYMLLSILGLELLVTFPCLTYYTDMDSVLFYPPLPAQRWNNNGTPPSHFVKASREGLMSVELSLAVRVMKFNRERPAPDAILEDNLHNLNVMTCPTETGFREGSSLEEVVEKQADLIEYLKQHNNLLSKRMLNLTAQH